MTGFRRVSLALVVCGASIGLGCDASGTLAGAPTPGSVGSSLSSAYLARANQGLAISPVPINLRGLSQEDRLEVGIGSYIVNAQGICSGCHSSQAGFLAGGNPFFLDNPPGQHVVWSRNLTPDPATGLPLTESQFITALRTGQDFHMGQTKMLIVMPWIVMRWMSEDDLESVYKYLRRIPAVNNPVPADTKSDLPLPSSIAFPNFYNDGDINRSLPSERDDDAINTRRGLAIAPKAQPQNLTFTQRSQYGRGSYIVNAIAHCSDCHTHPDRTADFSKINTAAYLSGGTVFKVPPPFQPMFHQTRTMTANLKGQQFGFFNEPGDSLQRFVDLIHTQSHVDENPPRPLGFPMNIAAGTFSNMIDEDLQDVYVYVTKVPNVTGANDAERQDYTRFCTSDLDCNGGAGETCFLATQECVGKSCSADVDCEACQTCGSGHCQAPAPNSLCLSDSR